ncbi:MAG: ATP-binding protein [Bacteroidota bacterium]
MNCRFVIAILFLILRWSDSRAQQLRFDHFDISNELSQNNITHLCVDDIGYVWIATLEGLNRFDGYQTKRYDNRSEKGATFKGNQIYALAKGRAGNIWVVSNNGLNRYNANSESFEVYGFMSSFLVQGTKVLKEDKNGLLWLSDGNKLSYFDRKSQKFKSVAIHSTVESILPVKSGILVSGSEGVFKISLSDETPEVDHIYTDSVIGLTMSADEKVYGISNSAILQWMNLSKSPSVLLDLKEGHLPPITIGDLNAFIAKENEIWIGGTYPLIKVQVDSKTTQVFTYDKDDPFSFQGYIVKNLEVDEYNNLWIGTSKHGLNLLEKRKNQFSYYNWGSEDRNQDIDPVRSILKTKSGDLWYAVDRLGVGIHKKNGSHKFYSSFHNCDGATFDLKRVRSIFEDSQGTIWIGGLDGLAVYNATEDHIEFAKCQNEWEWPYHSYVIKEFEKGELTISGKPNHLAIVDLYKNKLKTYTLDNGFGTIRDLIIDDEGNYWAALKNGVFKIDLKKNVYQLINSQNSKLSNDKVYNLLLHHDSLLIATNSGLNIYDIGQAAVVKSIYQTDGLVNDIVYSLKKDQRDRVWISTNNGISMLDLSTMSFTNYLEEDHFLDDAHYQGDGQIFFGGYDGITSFNPLEIESQAFKSDPVIEKFYLFNELVTPNSPPDQEAILPTSISTLEALHLDYTQNSFSFDFNAFPFNYPNNNKFRYRLIGQNDQWVYPIRSNRFASYSGLPPKQYELQVQVSQGREVWTPSTVLKINIIPPFWRQTWFQYLAYFTLIISVYTLYRLRMMNIRKRNRMLNKKVKEQTSKLVEKNKQILKQKNKIQKFAEKLHEADEAKLRFFTNVSHEFRTPLTLILGQLKNLSGEHAHQAIRSIKNNSLRLHRLVEQLIDLRKLDSDQMRLSISHNDIVSFTKNILDSFSFAADQKKIKLSFTSNADSIMLWFDTDKMDKILYNLISNALKYTPEHKSISVAISKQQNEVTISIKDEGIGIEKSQLDKVFERFYRGNQNSIEGHGIGLSLVKNFVEIQNAKIHVTSLMGQGTEFLLSFKAGKKHFSSSELLASDDQSISYVDHEVQKFPDHWEPYNAGKEILVVEDNMELSHFIKQVLSKYYRVILAKDGIEALEILEKVQPELVISDVMMPKMDGITFARKVKQNSATSTIPIILLSAKSDSETKITALEIGVEGFMEKPFSTQFLLLRVNTILSNRAKYRQYIVEHDSKLESSNPLNQIDKIFWKHITGFMNENLSNSHLSVDDMSKEMNMSRASFYRKFKSISEDSPGDHLRKVRLIRAKNLLIESELSIAQVSDAVGFQSLSHFRRSFKQEFQKTPSQIRTPDSYLTTSVNK